MSLLIVDDDAPIRKLLERVAVRAGFDADCARDGLEALSMLEQKQYAIAIIDLMMPRLSGYDLVQKISTMKVRPVIIVATAMINADMSKIDDTLVRRVIKKPFDVNVVAEALIETAKQIAEKQGLAPAPAPEATVIGGEKNEDAAPKKTSSDQPEPVEVDCRKSSGRFSDRPIRRSRIVGPRARPTDASGRRLPESRMT